MKRREVTGTVGLVPLLAAVGAAVLVTVALLFASGLGIGPGEKRHPEEAGTRVAGAAVEPRDVEAPRRPPRLESADADPPAAAPANDLLAASTIPPATGGDLLVGANVPANAPVGPSPLPRAEKRAAEPAIEQAAAIPSKPDPAAHEEPEGDEPPEQDAISGRVMDENGTPLPGIEVTASAFRLFEPGAKSTRAAAPGTHYAITDFAGVYEFWDLAKGEYRVSATPMGPHALASKTVRTGATSVDLLLIWQQSVTVVGVVRGPNGGPLDGVQVTALASPPEKTLTDFDGRYAVTFALKANQSRFAVQFKHPGYREERLQAQAPDADAGLGEVTLDATLEPEGRLASVRGSVRDAGGRPLAGQTVSLHSSSVRRGYQGKSDRSGRFLIAGVEPTADYRVLVIAQGPYRDHRQSGLEVDARGANLDVVLEPVATGRLQGQMVDMEGYAVPGFSLTLKSRTTGRHKVQVTGDADGIFSVDGIPEGAVELRSESSPRLHITGLRTSRDPKALAMVLLDVGPHDIHGWVTDRLGRPVAAARLNLRMVHVARGIRSFSARDAVTDAEGAFAFSGLGAGMHVLRVSAPGLVSTEFDIEVGPNSSPLTLELDEE